MPGIADVTKTIASPAAGRGRRDTIKGIVLVLAQALPIMAVVSLFPVIPKLMQQFGGMANATYLVPMIITLPSFGIALLSPAAGWLADRIGRRPVFVFAMALYCVMGLAPLFLNSLTLIVLSRAILGVAEAGIVTVASTLIADYFGVERFRWLAIQSGLGSVLGTLLIALGGWLADVSWRGPFAVYAAAVPLLLLAIFVIDEPVAQHRDERGSGRSAFPWAKALTIGFVSLVASILYYVEPTNIATIFHGRGVGTSSQIGLLQAATSLAYIAGAYLYKRLSRAFVGVQLGIAGILIGIGMIGIGSGTGYKSAAFWALAQQLGGGMVIPALTGWAQGAVAFDQRGRAMGIWATFFFAGLFLCPTVVALTTAFTGMISAAFAVLGGVAAVLAMLALATTLTKRPRVSA